eukprot:scaffold269858_cov17-Tisochrysis_lutea.AAC.1
MGWSLEATFVHGENASEHIQQYQLGNYKHEVYPEHSLKEAGFINMTGISFANEAGMGLGEEGRALKQKVI